MYFKVQKTHSDQQFKFFENNGNGKMMRTKNDDTLDDVIGDFKF